MPSIDPTIFDHLVLVALVVVLPWNGLRRFRSLEKAVGAGDSRARTRFFRAVVIQKWVFAAVLAGAWVTLGRSASSIGLTVSATPRAVAGYVLTALAVGAIVLLSRAAVHTEKGRANTHRSLAPVRAFVPHTRAERRWYNALSVTAGICEEFVFRGYLFAYLAAWLTGSFAVILVAALVFGLGHLYQGIPGILKTGVAGMLFGGLYVMTGSLIAPMVLHIAIDVGSGWVSWQVMRDAGPDLVHEPAAA